MSKENHEKNLTQHYDNIPLDKSDNGKQRQTQDRQHLETPKPHNLDRNTNDRKKTENAALNTEFCEPKTEIISMSTTLIKDNLTINRRFKKDNYISLSLNGPLNQSTIGLLTKELSNITTTKIPIIIDLQNVKGIAAACLGNLIEITQQRMRQCVNTDETLKYQIWYVNAPKKENFFLTLQNIPFPILPSFEDALQVIKQLKNLENIETITNEPFIQKEKQSSFQQGPGSDKTIFPVFNFLKITSFIKEISFALKKQTVKAIKDKILTLISKKSKPDSNQKSKDYIFEEYSCDNFNCRKLEYPNYILFKLMGTINNQNFPLLSKLLLNLSHFDSKIIILDFKNVNEISDSCLVNLYFFSLIQNEIIKKNNYYQKLTQGLLLTSIPDSIKPIFARVNLPYFVFKNIEAALKHITKNENDLKEPKSKNETEKEVTFYKECNYKGLKVKLKEMPTYFSLKFEGGITQDCVDFMDELLAKFNQKQKTVILDIANLKYISEEIGFYMLNAYLNSAKAHRYNILLTGVNPVYKNKFPHFPIYSDENTAIRNHLQIKKEETLKLLRKNEEFIIKGEVPSQKSTPDTKKQFNELQRAAQEIVSSINEQQLLLRKLNEEINILGKKLQND